MKIVPRKGQFFRIKARYDKGGWPCFVIVRVCGRFALTVQDCRIDGVVPDGLKPRQFSDRKGWEKLTKYWTPKTGGPMSRKQER